MRDENVVVFEQEAGLESRRRLERADGSVDSAEIDLFREVAVSGLLREVGSKLGNSIAASRDLRASLTRPAMATARAVGCIPVVVRMNNSSSSISLRRASE